MAGNLRTTPRRIWNILSSTRTGVVLLILVVIISAAGTLILQRPVTDPDEMQRAYSLQVLRLLDAVGLTDVFHAWWFVLLLILVSLSLIAASVQRFPNSWRFYSRPYRSADESFLKALAHQTRIMIEDEETGITAAERVLGRAGLKPQRIVRESSFSVFGERNRISELAVYVVHASLLLIFLGGIVDALYGWRGFLVLLPGEQASQLQLHDGVVRTLPFAIRCDGVGQENYADGTPKKWWSKLAIVEGGRMIARKEIVVNDPLIYGGIRFYQSSYGDTGKLERIILGASPASGKGELKELVLGMHETVALDTETSLQVAEFIPDYVVANGQVYARSNQMDNPAIHLIVESRKSGQAVNVWLPPIPGFEQNSLSPYRFEVRDLRMLHFTGLSVSHEPGQWTVWAGVVMMVLGLGGVFYLVHMRFWVVPLRDRHGRLMLWVGGIANKNKDVFGERFEELVREIKSEIKVQSGAEPRHRSLQSPQQESEIGAMSHGAYKS
ncbi:MAG TPA: cytochrome c biogenesis protein ResB [Candidatus Sulfotelmatobacter sp.]|nr:cytochrome c biogenesis protein ResB [Candidatus Sulfotelmatobacter sp.]